MARYVNCGHKGMVRYLSIPLWHSRTVRGSNVKAVPYTCSHHIGAVHLQPHKVPLIGVLPVLAPQNRKCCLVESLLLRQACKLLIDKSDRVTS
jgi:hypothetical protein